MDLKLDKAWYQFDQLVKMGVYSIDREGRIWKHKNRDRGGNLRSIPQKRAECRLKAGYLGLKFDRGGEQFLLLAHRIVFRELVMPIPIGLEVNHKDGNKTNNHPSNLELVTSKDNKLHALRTGLKPTGVSKRYELSNQAKELRSQGLSFSQIGKRLRIGTATAYHSVML